MKPAEMSRELKKPLQFDLKKPVQCEFEKPKQCEVVGYKQKDEDIFETKTMSSTRKRESPKIIANVKELKDNSEKADITKSDESVKRSLSFGSPFNLVNQKGRVEQHRKSETERNDAFCEKEKVFSLGYVGQKKPVKQGETEDSLENVKSTKAKRYEAFKYDERQEIKPRGNATVNKGHVSKSLDGGQQRANHKIIGSKEPVITKRVAIGGDSVDCHGLGLATRSKFGVRGHGQRSMMSPKLPVVIPSEVATAVDKALFCLTCTPCFASVASSSQYSLQVLPPGVATAIGDTLFGP
eukprot:gene3782-15065_t